EIRRHFQGPQRNLHPLRADRLKRLNAASRWAGRPGGRASTEWRGGCGKSETRPPGTERRGQRDQAGMKRPELRIGISGWTYPPWRGVFYPPGLAQKRELEYASRQVNSIEIN